MDFEIYAYWNTVELAAAFNAIVGITGSGDFIGLMKTLALVMIISLSLAALAGLSRGEDFWKWVIMLAMFHGMLLVPKSNVLIVDRTGTEPVQVVSNVPIGLASLAHTTSKIGDWLTTAFETTSSLPDDVQLRNNGTLFGHRVMRERLAVRTVNPILHYNLMEFYRECVWPDLIKGYLRFRDIAEAEDIWGSALNDTNPGLFVTIRDYNDPAAISTVTCPDAHTAIGAQLVVDANAALSESASRMYPGVNPTVARNAFIGALESTSGYLIGVSQSAPDIIKQAMVSNSIIDAGYTIPAQMGDAAYSQIKLAEAQAIRSYKTASGVALKLAESTMPKLRNAIELLAYALFPVMVLLIVVAGQYAIKFIKAYVGILLWVQLWPPLYAVMNFMMNVKAASAMTTATAGNGLALKYYSYLGTATVSDAEVAGYLAAAIPVIAWGIVQGSMMMAANAVASPANAAASAAAAGASQGNIGMGSYSEGTVSAGNVSAGQYNTQPTMRTGAPSMTRMDDGGGTLTTYGRGTTAYDASGKMSQINADLKMGSRTSAAFQQMSKEAETASVGHAASYVKETAAAMGATFDYVKARQASEGAGTDYGLGAGSEEARAAQRVTELADQFAEKHGLTQQQGAKVLAYAEMGAKQPGVVELFSPVELKAGLRAEGVSEAKANQVLEDAKTFAEKTGFSEAWKTTENAIKNNKFTEGDESSRRAGDAIRASLDTADRHADQANATHQKSRELAETATRARENSAVFEAQLTHGFIEWMKTQRNPFTGRNFDEGAITDMTTFAPESVQGYVDRFVEERVEPMLDRGDVGAMLTPEGVRAFYAEGRAAIPGAGDVALTGATNMSLVNDTATREGVDPTETVTSNVPDIVEQELHQTGKTVDSVGDEVKTQGQPLKGAAEYRTTPGNEPLLGVAVVNAGSQLASAVPEPSFISESPADKFLADDAAKREKDAPPPRTP